jgi:chemotaxis protein methyltransferase CheR
MAGENEKIEIELLLQAIYLKYGYDFRNYSRASLKRRILRRLSASGLGSISEMQHRLLNEAAFFDRLLRDFSINVTEMYRDPMFFHALKHKVMPNLKQHAHIKVWCAGCATGEEVYSVAIVLKEEGLYEQSKIYATDFNEDVLRKAKEGIYPLDLIKRSEQNYRDSGGTAAFGDYYAEKYGYATMKGFLKKNIIFADHNLATDSSFGEMQVVLCRNVLIYFNRELQDRAIRLFSESLADKGYLCLGTKESVKFSSHQERFKEVDGNAKIYQKV